MAAPPGAGRVRRRRTAGPSADRPRAPRDPVVRNWAGAAAAHRATRRRPAQAAAATRNWPGGPQRPVRGSSWRDPRCGRRPTAANAAPGSRTHDDSASPAGSSAYSLTVVDDQQGPARRRGADAIPGCGRIDHAHAELVGHSPQRRPGGRADDEVHAQSRRLGQDRLKHGAAPRAGWTGHQHATGAGEQIDAHRLCAVAADAQRDPIAVTRQCVECDGARQRAEPDRFAGARARRGRTGDGLIDVCRGREVRGTVSGAVTARFLACECDLHAGTVAAAQGPTGRHGRRRIP